MSKKEIKKKKLANEEKKIQERKKIIKKFDDTKILSFY